MSCERSRHIDIPGFLADPRGEEHRDFAAHYPTCDECAGEVASWTELEAVLVEATGGASHPADELLLAYRRAPGGLSAAQREEVSLHLEGCAPCRDALGATTGLDLEQLLAAPAAEPAAPGFSLADWLRGLFALPAPAWVAAAVLAVALAVGLPRLLGEDGPPEGELVAEETPEALPPNPGEAPSAGPEPAERVARAPEPVEEPPPPSPEPTPQQIVEAPPAPAPPAEEALPEPPAREEAIAQAPPPAPPAPVERPAPPQPPAEEPAAPPAGAPKLIVALGSEPIRFLPRVGLPAGRLTGARRGTEAERARPLALTPEAVGLTLERQPSLYWFLPEPSAAGVRVAVSDLGAMKTVLSATVDGPLRAGIHVLRLGAHGVRLTTDRNYQWTLTPAGAEAPASGGVVRRVAADAGLRATLSAASPAQRLRQLAAAGVWHDALDLLSRSIAARPSDAQLRRARADLLEQQGLPSAAAWDRSVR
jgi:outer membrane biosynthesis protein TonB